MKKLVWAQITAGLVMGFLLGGAFGLRQARQGVPEWMRYSRQEEDERMLRLFSEELGLTDAQREKVKVLLDSASQQTRALRAETRPRFRAIRAETSRGVRALLDEPQAARFDAIEKEWEVQKEQWRKKRDGGA